jgi:hypothetical protein
LPQLQGGSSIENVPDEFFQILTWTLVQAQSDIEMAGKEGKEEPPKVATDYDATEHLMSPDEVSAKYAVTINKEQPGKSAGLSGSEVRFMISVVIHPLD